MSPRTQLFHFCQNPPALGEIRRIGAGLQRFPTHLLAPTQPHSVHQRLPNRLRNGRAVSSQLCQSAFRPFIRPKVHHRHMTIIRHIVLHVYVLERHGDQRSRRNSAQGLLAGRLLAVDWAFLEVEPLGSELAPLVGATATFLGIDGERWDDRERADAGPIASAGQPPDFIALHRHDRANPCRRLLVRMRSRGNVKPLALRGCYPLVRACG